jgi:hypothetical protein
MSKPRILGQKTGFTPNSQADRRRVNRTFRHREYQKEVQLKKRIELDAAIADLDKMMSYASTSWKKLHEAIEALSSAAQKAAQKAMQEATPESAEKIKEAYERLSKEIKAIEAL